MLVKLARNLVLNDTRYRADPRGTQVPDHIKGVPVVVEAPAAKDGKVPEHILLPKGTVLLSDKVVVPEDAPEPDTLSAMSKKK